MLCSVKAPPGAMQGGDPVYSRWTMERLEDGWLDEWMDEWVDKWVDG